MVWKANRSMQNINGDHQLCVPAAHRLSNRPKVGDLRRDSFLFQRLGKKSRQRREPLTGQAFWYS
jgi:hypothetical protein